MSTDSQTLFSRTVQGRKTARTRDWEEEEEEEEEAHRKEKKNILGLTETGA